VAEEGGAGHKLAKARDALEKCEEQLHELQEENAQLRESAQAFGDLAERLNSRRKSAAQRRAEETSSKR